MLAVERRAVTVDAALELGRDVEDGVAQRVALEEVVGELVERAVVIVVHPRVALEHADQDFAVELVVAVEREAGAIADQDAVGRGRGREASRSG